MADATPQMRSTILVVEDNPTEREGLSMVFERAGHVVALAENGQKALEYLANHTSPSLILLDMLMPVLDGWHFLQILHGTVGSQTPPIIVTTANPSIGPDWARAHGCADVFHKPIDFDVLLELVDKRLS